MPSDTDAGPVVALRAATKRYPGVLALDAADFALRPGEVRALLGRNGAGKSTLIRLLTGAETPDEGEVLVGGRPLVEAGSARTLEAASRGVRAVYQELSLVPGMSVAENMFLGRWPRSGPALDHAAMASRTQDAMAVLGLSIDPRREVSTLSIAECQLVEIARAVMGEPRLVILDEPTSSLHAAEVRQVFAAVRSLAARGIGVIYVSHRMAEIREVAESATVIRDGRIIETLPVRSARTEDIVRLMLGREEDRAQPAAHPAGHLAAQPAGSAAPGEVALSVEDLVLPPKLAGVSFSLRAGEVLGIAGLLGSGRTELLRAIAGLDRPASGRVRLLGQDVTGDSYGRMVRRGLGFTPENRKAEGILPQLGVDENVALTDLGRVSSGGVLSWPRLRAAARAVIDRLAIRTASEGTEIATLSGGNQQKAVIGRWLHAEARVLLLDEPTRGVDVDSKRQIYEIIRTIAASGAAVVFVSSEVEELPLVCDRALVLSGGRIDAAFEGKDLDADRLMTASMSASARAA